MNAYLIKGTPYQVCYDCGINYGNAGRMVTGTSTYHIGRCDVCGKEQAVTEARDFGYIRDEVLTANKLEKIFKKYKKGADGRKTKRN